MRSGDRAEAADALSTPPKVTTRQNNVASNKRTGAGWRRLAVHASYVSDLRWWVLAVLTESCRLEARSCRHLDSLDFR